MKFDVIVVGGGLVGASLALALAKGSVKVGLIESREPPPLPEDDSWDSRVYAISPGSAEFLQKLGVWQALDQARITPVYDMAVFGDDNASRIDFSAYDIGCSALAFIVENRQLQAAVWKGLKRERKNVTLLCPAQCALMTRTESQVHLHLSDGTELQAALIVGADGLNSWVREQAGIETKRQPYDQTGVVANFEAELHHRNIAYQWFRRDGILALLPLPDTMVSMVWSANEEQARKLLESSHGDLCNEVMEASCGVLGHMRMVTPPAAFPLNFVHVNKLVQPRLALIGDAAHGIHPLAGQGVNLGLRDARELTTTILMRGLQADCGDYLLLRRYERARKEDILALELATDGLQKLFTASHPTLIRLRNVGLEMTNRLPLLKDRLMRHALG
jgi:2-polyprenylphenol 6-hydroxylase